MRQQLDGQLQQTDRASAFLSQNFWQAMLRGPVARSVAKSEGVVVIHSGQAIKLEADQHSFSFSAPKMAIWTFSA